MAHVNPKLDACIFDVKFCPEENTSKYVEMKQEVTTIAVALEMSSFNPHRLEGD
jgi:hypothetical protein